MCSQEEKSLPILLSLFNVGRYLSPALWEQWNFVERSIQRPGFPSSSVLTSYWLRIFLISPLVKSTPSPTCLCQVSSCSLLFVPLLCLYLGPESIFLSLGCSPCKWWSLLAPQGFGFQVHSHLEHLIWGSTKSEWDFSQLRVPDKCNYL